MYSHYSTYQKLGFALAQEIANWYIECWFSTGKDELVLQLRSSKGVKQIVFSFFKGELFILWDVQWRNFGNRCIKWFIETDNEKIIGVQAIENERAIRIELENKGDILIKGFGIYGNILYFETNALTQHFRQHLRGDNSVQLADYTVSREWISSVLTEENQFGQAIKYTFKALNKIPETSFYSLTAKEQNLWLAEQSKLLLKKYLHFENGNWHLIDSATDYNVETQKFLKFARAEEWRTNNLRSLNKRLEQKQKLVLEYQKQITNASNPRNYKQQADLLLIYMPVISENTQRIQLEDPLSSVLISIKVNPKLNAQQNAEKLYKKAKNEHLEFAQLAKKEINAKDEIEAIKKSIIEIENGEVKRINSVKKTDNIQIAKPYKLVLIENTEIWIGKGAVQNDAMLKLAHKQDLWLHARGVAGSHVIIRSMGKQISRKLLESAAKLAVENSKAKNHTLVPVIYTQRKYVSKPKNAPAGMVKVLKEEVIDIQND